MLSVIVLVVPLLGVASLSSAAPAAVQPASIPYSGSETGVLVPRPDTFADGQEMFLVANFPSDAEGESVTFYQETPAGSDNYESIGTDSEANRWGNANLTPYVVDGEARVFARIDSSGDVTQLERLVPQVREATLDPIITVGSDARATATYTPVNAGALTRLQYRRIKDGAWKSVDTSTQRSDGTTTFDIADPLEVEHEYRAVGKGGYGSNVVKYAGPLLDKNNDVPTVHFNSNDGESVNTRDKWFKGELSILSGTTDQNKDGSLENCSTVDKIEAEMKGRGNYSWSFSKKGFNLKLEDSLDLCDMGKSKKWALVANHYDRSLLRNSAAGFVGKVFTNLEWTPKDSAVDLYVNGSFRGSYILIERVNFEGGRLDVDELKAEDTPELCSGPDPSVDTTSPVSGSYLMEWDFRKGANFNFGANNHGWVGLKEPEDEDYCQNMGAYINDYVDRADRDLYDGSASSNDWLSSIDLASAVDYYLAMEFLKPVDGQMWASVYMYKPRGEKIHFGPLWDFDLAMGSATRAGNVVSPRGWYLRNPLNVSAKQTEVTWFNRMNQNPTFRAAAKKRWNEIDQDIHGELGAYLRDQEDLIDRSASDNYRKWNHGAKISKYQVIKSSWGADVDYLVSWLDKRWHYMNGQLDNDD